jgi:peptide/nickel transport system permease protein
MLNFIAKRLLLLIPTLFFVTTVVFFLVHFVPGDPVDLILGEQALSVDKELFRKAMNLDLPLGEQYINFYSNLFQGDLGNSLFERRGVTELLLERVPASLQLAIASLIISLFLSLTFGILSAIKKDTAWDRGTLLASLIGISIPNFWLGPLLILLFSTSQFT